MTVNRERYVIEEKREKVTSGSLWNLSYQYNKMGEKDKALDLFAV